MTSEHLFHKTAPTDGCCCCCCCELHHLDSLSRLARASFLYSTIVQKSNKDIPLKLLLDFAT